ncbi:uncharacterized protein MELLADRAFT_62896 [Melampsora larici-populina 98AG31]|uniref:Uncharacterized protein n=1 Tax=Melampsora larici-populina (strain 98AG31 / pathotype 3-4-7) TaxID=747676 RepID=F4RKN7_MELLP|nr:uncharacterized protein MELLADRAFT_62896 [Melampsora larici-populina 98AG31]EGG07124.1 hypothetical protein MELLADRAFT_62896 [Melampsora larici-populina 98AG31]
MVVATLIKAEYRLANPESPLPLPKRRGLVGIHCPVCSTPMKYLKSNEDSWLIGCPTPNNSHNWKWWRCDQLNHELALLNLGAPRPIISSESDWGPRVSPTGQILEPKPHPNQRDGSNHRHHPYLQPPLENTTTHHTSARAPRSTPVVKCQRSVEGPTAQSHKSAANKACLSQYCRGCCLAFGSPLCRQHPCVLPSAAPLDIDMPINPTSSTHLTPHLAASTFTGSNGGRSSRAPASQAQPHQWAQASNTLGRRIDVQSVALIQQLRAQRDQAAQLKANSLIEEKHMATIHLWVKADEKQAITAKFPQWPLVRLDQSPLLIQAVIKVLGSQWNQALSFWDEEIYAWHDTLVSYPHRYASRTIVVRLPNVTLPVSVIPVTIQAGADLDSAPGSQLPQTAPSTPSLTQSGQNAVNPSEAEQTNIDEPSASVTLKKHWPSPKLLIANLLQWYQETVDGNIKEKWMDQYGGEWQLKTATMYRYRSWINEVTYPRFHAKYGSQPRAAVGEARIFYKAEFNRVAYVKAKEENEPAEIGQY